MLGIALLLVILAWTSLTPDIALSQQVESRIGSLEFDIRDIESRLNRIESQLNQSGNRVNSRTPATQTPNNSGRNRSQPSREQMFDRLATLVIELKQQVNKLETRVSSLEKQEAPRNTR